MTTNPQPSTWDAPCPDCGEHCIWDEDGPDCRDTRCPGVPEAWGAK